MKCLSWNILAALGAAAVAIWWLAPGAAAAAVPLLVLLACPLSMVLMMGAMGAMGARGASGGEESEVADLRAQVAALRDERDGIAPDESGRAQ